MEDPLLGQMKKQLVLKIISGQQLPKPKDSMLGDRGEVGRGWLWSWKTHCIASYRIFHSQKHVNLAVEQSKHTSFILSQEFVFLPDMEFSYLYIEEEE